MNLLRYNGQPCLQLGPCAAMLSNISNVKLHTQLHYITQCVCIVDLLLPAGSSPMAAHCVPAAGNKTPFGSTGSEQTPSLRVQLSSFKKCLDRKVTTNTRAQAVVYEYCGLGSARLGKTPFFTVLQVNYQQDMLWVQ